MPTYVVGPKDLGKQLEDFSHKRFEALVESMRTTVKVHAPRIAQTLVNQENPKPVDRGTYRRSFAADDVPGGVVFYNFAPHAAIIEEGRRPGAKMPPLQVIFDWVRRKKIGATLAGPVQDIHGPLQRVRTGKKTKKGQDAFSTKKLQARKHAVLNQQRFIALQIARKIAAHGLPAHQIVARTEHQLTPIVRRAISAILGKDIAER